MGETLHVSCDLCNEKFQKNSECPHAGSKCFDCQHVYFVRRKFVKSAKTEEKQENTEEKPVENTETPKEN